MIELLDQLDLLDPDAQDQKADASGKTLEERCKDMVRRCCRPPAAPRSAARGQPCSPAHARALQLSLCAQVPEEKKQHFATLYIRYLQIFRKLEESYDQMVHPQKRMDIKKARRPPRRQPAPPRARRRRLRPLPLARRRWRP